MFPLKKNLSCIALHAISEMSMVYTVTCLFSLFEALNGAFELQIFQGFICTPYQRH